MAGAEVEPAEDAERRDAVVRAVEMAGRGFEDEPRSEEHGDETHGGDDERTRGGSDREPRDSDRDDQRCCDVDVTPVQHMVGPGPVLEEGHGHGQEESEDDDDHCRRDPAFGVRAGPVPGEEHQRHDADTHQPAGRHELVPRLARAHDDRVLDAVARSAATDLGGRVDAAGAVPDGLVQLVVQELTRVRDHCERDDRGRDRDRLAVAQEVSAQQHEQRQSRRKRPPVHGHQVAGRGTRRRSARNECASSTIAGSPPCAGSTPPR